LLNSIFLVDVCLLLLKIFPTSILFLKSKMRAESYGLWKFRLFYPIYHCMLKVSYFSSSAFSGTHNQNPTPPLASMGHNISINYSCTPNGLLSMELFPLEVKLVPKFNPRYFGYNFLIKAMLCEPFSSLNSSPRVILFELQRHNVPWYTLFSWFFTG